MSARMDGSVQWAELEELLRGSYRLAAPRKALPDQMAVMPAPSLPADSAAQKDYAVPSLF